MLSDTYHNIRPQEFYIAISHLYIVAAINIQCSPCIEGDNQLFCILYTVIAYMTTAFST